MIQNCQKKACHIKSQCCNLFEFLNTRPPTSKKFYPKFNTGKKSMKFNIQVPSSMMVDTAGEFKEEQEEMEDSDESDSEQENDENILPANIEIFVKDSK